MEISENPTSNEINIFQDILELQRLKANAYSLYESRLPQWITAEHLKPLGELIVSLSIYIGKYADPDFITKKLARIPTNPQNPNELIGAYKLIVSNIETLIGLLQNKIPYKDNNNLSTKEENIEFKNYIQGLFETAQSDIAKLTNIQLQLNKEKAAQSELEKEISKLKNEIREKSQHIDRTEYNLNQETTKALNLQTSLEIVKNELLIREKSFNEKTLLMEGELSALKDKKQKEEVVKNSKEFKSQARVSKINASLFLGATVLALGGFIYFLFHLLSNDYELFNVATGIIDKSQKIDPKIYSQLIIIEIIKRLSTKLLIFSTIIYGITFLVKNYNAQMHNYIANSHKANALLSTVNLIGTAREDEGNDKIILQATQAIFTSQKSGYQGAENEPTSPNLITNVIDAVSGSKKS